MRRVRGVRVTAGLVGLLLLSAAGCGGNDCVQSTVGYAIDVDGVRAELGVDPRDVDQFQGGRCFTVGRDEDGARVCQFDQSDQQVMYADRYPDDAVALFEYGIVLRAPSAAALEPVAERFEAEIPDTFGECGVGVPG